MANLVFKGHKTRGRELYKLLELLGGTYAGYSQCSFANCYYYINREGYIESSIEIPMYMDEFVIMTLDGFESKYSYKVGDKVIDMNGLHGIIVAMSWDECNCTVRYTFEDDEVGTHRHGYTALMLKPYIVDTGCCSFPTTQPSDTLSVGSIKDMKRSIVFSNDSPDETELVLGDNYEVKVKEGKTYVVKKQPKYPKTYEECCKVLLLNPEKATYSVCGLEYKRHLIVNFQRLLVCRDAYWKIAGDWHPNWEDGSTTKYTISCVKNKIELRKAREYTFTLAFPTEEMRDTFCENFKDLIEECKELL